jgi:hypothetical protein
MKVCLANKTKEVGNAVPLRLVGEKPIECD